MEVAQQTWHQDAGKRETHFVLVKAECGICKHTWDIQALDAEMCDLIHGETFASAFKCLWSATSDTSTKPA